MRFLLVLLTGLCPLAGSILHAQTDVYDIDKEFSATQLKEDFQILRQSLETIHPAIYTYQSKEDLDRRFDQMAAAIQGPMTELEFYKLIGVLLKEIADGHTDIEASSACYEMLDASAKLFPFQVKWVEDALYITHNFSSVEEVRKGDMIKTINGKEVGPIFKQLRDYMPRDGKIVHGPNQVLARLFMDFYYFMVERPEGFDLELEAVGGDLRQIYVPAETLPSIEANIKKRYPSPKNAGNNKKPQLELELESDHAILTVRSFHPGRIKDGGQHFSKFFKQAFTKLEEAEVEHLILDLRNNGGGAAEVVRQLLSYLAEKPFRLYRQQIARTTRIPNHEHFRNNIRKIESWARKNLRKSGDHYVLIDGDSKVQKQQTPGFKGQLYVLVNERSYSATADFVGMLRSLRPVEFIGQETGGNPLRSTGGERLTLVLPHSKIRVLIPTIQFQLNVDAENQGHGLMPDHLVVPTIRDYLAKRDVEKEFARALISKRIAASASVRP